MSLLLRFLTFNAHLFGRALGVTRYGPWINRYDDERRALQIADVLLGEDEQSAADVLGLTEVWDAQLQEVIVERLRGRYPYAAFDNISSTSTERRHSMAQEALRHFSRIRPRSEGGGLTFLGSGLLLLSKYPWVDQPQFTSFAHATSLRASLKNFDSLTTKGVLSAVIAPMVDFPCGIFLAHSQADYISRQFRSVRWEQLQTVARRVGKFRQIYRSSAAVCMGDLNVVGGTDEWQDMLRLLQMEDPFPKQARCNAAAETQFTYDSGSNPLIGRFAPANIGLRERLDYVLVSSQGEAVTVSTRASYILPDLFRDPVSSTPLSDHYAMVAEFLLKGRDV